MFQAVLLLSRPGDGPVYANRASLSSIVLPRQESRAFRDGQERQGQYLVSSRPSHVCHRRARPGARFETPPHASA